MDEQPAREPTSAHPPTREVSQGFADMLGRMIADPDFRRALADDAERALQDAGLQLDTRELARIRAMTPEDRQQLLGEIDPDDKRAWWDVVWRWVSWW